MKGRDIKHLILGIGAIWLVWWALQWHSTERALDRGQEAQLTMWKLQMDQYRVDRTAGIAERTR